MCGLFQHGFIQKFGRFLWPVHLYGEKFVFSVTARYIVHMSKLRCQYASFDKFYNLNVSVVLASLYSKLGRYLLFPVALHISTRFLDFSEFLII